MKTISSNFHIRKENFPIIVETLKSNYGYDYGDFLFIRAKSIESIFAIFGWNITVNPFGCNDIHYNRSEYYEKSFDVIRLIAPYVEPGSYIEMIDDDGVWREYFDGQTCERFASEYHYSYINKNIKGETKKGKWLKVGGYATPGGDPVWKCSECGKGIHVYGIEANSYNSDITDGHQWVACPNCGAKMEETK